MEKIKREIRLFFVSYGRLLLYIIGIIALIILAIQGLNQMVIEQSAKNNNNLNSYKIVTMEEKNEEIREKEYISKFINYCNEGKIESAYDMLSDRSKEEKYINIEEFKSKYINEVFNIYICDYEILNINNKYKVTLIQDMLFTGKNDSKLEQTYQIDGVLEQKIHIVN